MAALANIEDSIDNEKLMDAKDIKDLDVNTLEQDGGRKRRKNKGSGKKRPGSSKHRTKGRKRKGKGKKQTKKVRNVKKINYLSFCKMYAKKHGLKNARAAMTNPNCKKEFHAMK